MHVRTVFSRFAATFLALGAIGMAHAQFQSHKVSLYKHLNLAFFGAGSGNDCWGYVSPSGREYAIIGLNNQVAFVEITDPTNPVVAGTIPHSAGLWATVEVYQNYCYVATETTGTGIQVIDLSNIDAQTNRVELVRTITSPGRTHNLVCDTVNGFLYTCGSRDGTGTTMCFSLANPANPVRVGANSMTGTNYMHDGLIVTYTSGSQAGRQIWYGFSTSRGVDVYDFTNKSAPVLIRRITYPSIGYCHQGTLSPDRKYLYVDDEFDEDNLNIATRTIILDVERPELGSYVGTFTSGIACVDHDQFQSDHFIFQANYRSGLRIFDTYPNPTAPTQVGWFDTYPANDAYGYNGAWSNWPYFPSGTVIVGDIEGGLFILNALEATTRNLAPFSMALLNGRLISGTVSSLVASDDQRLLLMNDNSADVSDFPIRIVLSTTAVDNEPLRMRAVVESALSFSSGYGQIIELYDWTTNQYEQVDFRAISMTEATAITNWVSNPARFVNPSSREVRMRLNWMPIAADDIDFGVFVDYVSFDITR